MVYFFILPAFALAVLVLLLGVGVAGVVPACAPIRPYGWRILLASSAGFVAANLLLMALVVMPLVAWNAARLPQKGWHFDLLCAFAAFGLTLGPFFASAIGFLGGGYLGFRIGRRAREARTAPQPIPSSADGP